MTLADHANPLPDTVIARCADTTASHGILTIESPWPRCSCGAVVNVAGPGVTAAIVREIAEAQGWARDADTPWRCPVCIAKEKKRRAAA